MKPFEKLFVHLFAKGIEHYRDSTFTLKMIDDILSKDEDLLYTELWEAFNQAKRLNIMQEYGLPIDDDDTEEPKDLPDDLLKRLLTEAIEINKIRDIIHKQSEKRC